jgi:hypothetical protein
VDRNLADPFDLLPCFGACTIDRPVDVYAKMLTFSGVLLTALSLCLFIPAGEGDRRKK